MLKGRYFSISIGYLMWITVQYVSNPILFPNSMVSIFRPSEFIASHTQTRTKVFHQNVSQGCN